MSIFRNSETVLWSRLFSSAERGISLGADDSQCLRAWNA